MRRTPQSHSKSKNVPDHAHKQHDITNTTVCSMYSMWVRLGVCAYVCIVCACEVATGQYRATVGSLTAHNGA